MIRQMKSQDIASVVLIENQSFSTPWSKESFKAEMINEKAYYIVYELDNNIIGYGGFWKILDEGHFTNLAIKPIYRGNGYGKQLIQGMMELAKTLNIDKVTLEVRESNIIALKAYATLGFYIEGKRSRYYANPIEDAIIMWASLQ